MDYKIASINMNRFGEHSWKTKDLSTLAEVITNEEFDIVAFQEIFSEGKGVKYLLDELVKYELFEWDYCFNMPKQGEGYAYLWNKRRFKLVEFNENGKKRVFEPRIINSLSRDVHVDCNIFARTPYYIRLEPLYGDFFEFRLINIHIFFGNSSLPSLAKRNIEFNVLTQEIYPEICSTAYGNFRVSYTIAMGDYNLNLYSPSIKDKHAIIPTSIYSYEDHGRAINICTVQEQLTTLKDREDGYANNYDHFTYSPELSPFLGVSVEAVDVVNKYYNGTFSKYREKFSDHLPILMTVKI